MRKYHDKYDKYDKDGLIARSGKIIKSRLNKEIKIEKRKQWNRRLRSISSLDIKDYITTYLDTVFTKGLSLRDGAATLTEFTVLTISSWINTYCKEMDYYNSGKKTKVIVCGGGRKNKFLLKSISKKIKHKLVLIDKYGIDGDFVESQAFAYLAIRSYLKLPISFPSTTGVSKPCTGGVIVKN
jgi:anhydro-N-acetylmuramic acid kinase